MTWFRDSLVDNGHQRTFLISLLSAARSVSAEHDPALRASLMLKGCAELNAERRAQSKSLETAFPWSKFRSMVGVLRSPFPCRPEVF
jgi:hypothetical protein